MKSIHLEDHWNSSELSVPVSIAVVVPPVVITGSGVLVAAGAFWTGEAISDPDESLSLSVVADESPSMEVLNSVVYTVSVPDSGNSARLLLRGRVEERVEARAEEARAVELRAFDLLRDLDPLRVFELSCFDFSSGLGLP